jgi:hypothetical protein
VEEMQKLTLLAAVLVAINLIPFSAPPAMAGGSEDLPSTDTILRRYVEASGGMDAIESLETRVTVGRLIHDLSWKVPPREVTPFAAYAAVPGRVLMVEHKGEGTRCEGFDRRDTWVQDAGGITSKDEPFRSKTAWLFDPQGSLRIEEYFPGLEFTSTKMIDGRRVYVLESPGLDSAHYALAFDSETGLLTGIGYYWSILDYREVDGIKIPHRVEMSRKGGSSTFVLDLVKHNLPLEDVLFSEPASLR